MASRKPVTPDEAGGVLVGCRNDAQELHERLEAAFAEAASDDEARRLEPLCDAAMVLAATLDYLQHGLTGQPLTTRLAERIEVHKWARAHGLTEQGRGA